MLLTADHLIATASVLILAAGADPVLYQDVLESPHEWANEPRQSGHLWRFDVGHGSAETVLEQVLSLAEVRTDCPTCYV